MSDAAREFHSGAASSHSLVCLPSITQVSTHSGNPTGRPPPSVSAVCVWKGICITSEGGGETCIVHEWYWFCLDLDRTLTSKVRTKTWWVIDIIFVQRPWVRIGERVSLSRGSLSPWPQRIPGAQELSVTAGQTRHFLNVGLSKWQSEVLWHEGHGPHFLRREGLKQGAGWWGG